MHLCSPAGLCAGRVLFLLLCKSYFLELHKQLAYSIVYFLMVIKKQYSLLVFILLVFVQIALAQDTTTHFLTIQKEVVSKTGKKVMGMTVNGTVPGPVLEFTEGDYAVIYVENKMDVETSVHWHGLILPNFQDGVPYLTTPPIQPGTTLKYEFRIKQAGTYWYHSHTMLQEQSGVYGAIVIKPKEKSMAYDKDFVLVLSDWTDQKPMNVLRNLKRGNEWYNIKKGTATPLNRVIKQGGLKAQLKFWRQRMESADIADVYYNAFLINGKLVQNYPMFKAGEKVRLRIVNASASSQYWLTFGGQDPLLVAADGNDVVPVKRNKTFIAIAETYDFIITLPQSGKIEIRAMAQDGSGVATAYMGEGDTLAAEVLQRPNKIELMKQMAKMDMRMGAPAMKFMGNKERPHKMMSNWGMRMKGQAMPAMQKGEEKAEHQHDTMQMKKMSHSMQSMGMFAEYNYDYLKSPYKTSFDTAKPVRNVLLNLTGNMWRYIWSMNGVPLAKADKIKIKKGEVTRITLKNLTMMHHPMHLHGHFFRVVNKNGEYSPLKHTVNVAPMQKVVIEFDGTETGDWFFHCHVLYHMMSGMARVYSYGTPRDPRMQQYNVKKLLKEGKRYYKWGMVDLTSHMGAINLVATNTRNRFMFSTEYGWNKNFETELTYDRFLYDYLMVFGGVNVENENENSIDDVATTAIAGFRFFTPYMFNLDVRVDNLLRPQIGISRSLMVFQKVMVFGEYEYQADFGWVNEISNGNNSFKQEVVWNAGVSYILSRNFSITASYDNRFGAGIGLSSIF